MAEWSCLKQQEFDGAVQMDDQLFKDMLNQRCAHPPDIVRMINIPRLSPILPLQLPCIIVNADHTCGLK